MIVCNQCGKTAVVKFGGNPLCVSCYALLQQTETAKVEADNDHLRLLSAQLNHSIDEMDMMFGLPIGQAAKIRIPQRAVPYYSTVSHSVSVQGGVVGAINTGQAGNIAVAIGETDKRGNKQLSQTLKEFTDAFVADSTLTSDQKRIMADQLSFLSSELVSVKDARRPGLIMPVLEGLGKAATVSNALLALWKTLHPLLTAAFQ